MEAKTAQLRVKKGPNGATVISAYGATGAIFFETPTRARFLIDTGGFELVNASSVGPAESKPIGPGQTKPSGPSETKPAKKQYTSNANEEAARGRDIMSGTIRREIGPGDMGYDEKKSSAAAPAGPSTDSQQSSESGPDIRSSASAEAPASAPSRSLGSRARGRQTGSE